MSRGFRLAGVLRVRQIEEDLARARVAQRQAGVSAARATAAERDARLAQRERPADGSAAAFTTEMSGLRAMALGLAQAAEAVAAAERSLQADTTAWAAARGRVRGLERLAERHEEAVAADDLRTAQAEVDDLVGARDERRAP